MNIHGKNNFAVGTIGEHVERVTLLTPSGEIIECSRDVRPDVFRSAVGGFGMFGCFTSITLRLKARPGRPSPGQGLRPALAARGRRDLRAREAGLGLPRGLAGRVRARRASRARDHPQGRLRRPGRGSAGSRRRSRVDAQHLPPRFLGVVPRNWMRTIIRPLVNDAGMPLVNRIKYWRGGSRRAAAPHFQSHAAFAFLLDYVPEWRRAYGRGRPDPVPELRSRRAGGRRCTPS